MAPQPASVPAHRPENTVRPGDYEILLGESLKQSKTSNNGLLSLCYNYRPDKGLWKSTLTKHKVGPRSSYKLVVEDKATNEPAYIYNGRDVSNAKDDARQDTPTLALVFDKTKSAFALETVTTSLDFNLTSAPAEPDKDIHNYPQLSTMKTAQKPSDNSGEKPATSPREDGSDSPDAANPYDYRHFLDEARDAVDHAAVADARSPLPGSRTPMSGMPSPVPGASCFLNNGASTQQFRPAPTSAPAQKKRKVDDPPPTTKQTLRSQPATKTTKKSATQRKRGDSKASVPLSKERISDSSDDSANDAGMSDTITVARPYAQQQTSAPKQTKSHRSYLSEPDPIARPGSSSSQPLPHSPHIVVDDLSGLEIDMGSPPRASSAQKKRSRQLNRNAFRSQTGTPSLSFTRKTPQQQLNQQAQRDVDSDTDMPDAASHGHEHDGHLASGASDNDVEALSLGSPRTNTRTIGSSHPSSRIQSVGPAASDSDDEDAALAAELEAALEEEDENLGVVGLGISGSGGNNNRQVVMDDEESEVSEEE